jgi:flagellar biosynthetic protein FliR
VVALQTGLSLGQIISPSIDTGGPALGQLYSLLGLAVFVSVGGPASSLTSVANSLQRIPPGSPIVFDGGAMALLATTGQLFGYAVQIAAPVMVAVTVTNVAIAIINRAVPQLNAMAMSFAITLGVGLLMFGVSLPLVVRTMSRWVTQAPTTAASLVELMAGERAR